MTQFTNENLKPILFDDVLIMHPNSYHHARYPLEKLVSLCPPLKQFIKLTPDGAKTIDFSDPKAVFWLNKALLNHYYNIEFWQLPEGYLCPPVPGRADYLHYLADLLAESSPQQQIPTGQQVKVLDIGTGANCIYPLLGEALFGWQFIASDIDPVSVHNATQILTKNNCSSQVVLQTDSSQLFKGVLNQQKLFATMCNPPFYHSLKQAEQVNLRKQQKLNQNRLKKGLPKLKLAKSRNFGGQQAELWCDGGELKFLTRMINQSVDYAKQVQWFTSLVSDKANLFALKRRLKQLNAKQIKVINMGQGQKTSRILAWQF